MVDGAWLLPSIVTKLKLPDTEVRAVYVVQRTEADVEAALIPRRGGLPLEDRHRLMNRRIFQYGAWLADEARAHDLPVVEALPFESLLDRPGCAALALKGPTSRRSWPPHRRSLSFGRSWRAIGGMPGLVSQLVETLWGAV